MIEKTQSQKDSEMIAVMTAAQIVANYFFLFPDDLVLSVTSAIIAGVLIRVGLLFYREWSK